MKSFTVKNEENIDQKNEKNDETAKVNKKKLGFVTNECTSCKTLTGC